MPSNVSSRRTWALENEDIIAAFESDGFTTRRMQWGSTFIDRCYRLWLDRGYISPAQTATLRRALTERGIEGLDHQRLSADAPRICNGPDLPEVPNGNFALTTRSTAGEDGVHSVDTDNIQIYTVSRGVLMGNRIIKRFINGGWKGFAFLMTDGSLKVWSRFRADEEAGANYITAAEKVVELLRGRRDHTTTTIEISGTDTTPSYRLECLLVCRMCNGGFGLDYTSLGRGMCFECRMEHEPQAVATAEVTDVGVTEEPGYARRRVARPRAPRPRTTAASASNPAVGRPSEIDTSWEQ